MNNMNTWWMRSVGLLICLTLLLSACTDSDAALLETAAPEAGGIDWREEVIYFALTDRFSNGDTSNDNGGARAGAADEADTSNPLGWHGGDFAGLEAKIKEGYFERMGFTALWITPVYLQVPAITAEGGAGPNVGRRFAGYHGYWAEDFFQVDPHLGTLDELKSLIATAQAQDLKIIQDMVVNHVGYGASLADEEPNWLPQRQDCYSPGATGDDIDVNCALAGLPDFDQSNAEAAAYLDEAVRYWRDEIGIDGIRMDTVKHVEDSYWRSFFGAGGAGDPSEIWTVGEIFSGDIPFLASYLDELNMPATFDFPLYFRIKDHLSSNAGNLDEVASLFAQDDTYSDPSRLVTFVDNHDVRRFMSEAVERGVPESEARERLDTALSLIYTVRGTPVVYQGTETAMQGLGDPYDYELGSGNREDMDFGALADSSLDERLAALAEARSSYPALTKGEQQTLWQPNGGANIFAYRRVLEGEDSVVMVLNNSDSDIDLSDLSGGGIPLLDSFAADANLSEVTGRVNTLSINAQGRLVGTVPARTLLAVASDPDTPDPDTPDPDTPDPDEPDPDTPDPDTPTTPDPTVSTVTFTVDARSQGAAELEIRRFDTGEQLEYALTPVDDQKGFWTTSVELPLPSELEFKFGNDAPLAKNGGYEGDGQGNRTLIIDEPAETFEAVYDFIDVAAPDSQIEGTVSSSAGAVSGAVLDAGSNPELYYALSFEDGSYYLPLPGGSSTTVSASATGFATATQTASAGASEVDFSLNP